MDERGDDKSTLVTTQDPPANWSEIIDDPVTCEAITDRLVSTAEHLRMKGASYRPDSSARGTNPFPRTDFTEAPSRLDWRCGSTETGHRYLQGIRILYRPKHCK